MLIRSLAVAVLLSSQISAQSPNLLVIVSDDQGWNDIGYHNASVITPNLDRLAKSGVRLNQHYVCPTCSPTRVGLLSGRYPSRFGILTPIAGKSKKALPKSTLTLASMLKTKGYETAITGKWHLGLRTEVGPRQYGFDHTYGYLHGQIDPITKRYKFGDRTWHRNDKLIEEKGHATDLLTDEAIRVIKKKRSKPFFLYVPYSVPHTPFVESEKWMKMYPKVKEFSRRIYLASITHMDAGIGRIIQALNETGQLERTLILFSSDNGGQKSGNHGKQYGGKFPPYPVLADNSPLRGFKGSVYEGGIRVPAFVSWKGQLKPGKTDEVMHIVDWLPTVASLVEAKIPEDANLDGRNVWPAILNRERLKDRTLYWRTPRSSAVRVGNWKLTQSGGKKPELFNLAADPNEKKNLADKNKEKVKELQRELMDERARDSKE